MDRAYTLAPMFVLDGCMEVFGVGVPLFGPFNSGLLFLENFLPAKLKEQVGLFTRQDLSCNR